MKVAGIISAALKCLLSSFTVLPLLATRCVTSSGQIEGEAESLIQSFLPPIKASIYLEDLINKAKSILSGSVLFLIPAGGRQSHPQTRQRSCCDLRR